MKQIITKTVSVILALIFAFSAAFSANAADFNQTKTKKFLEKLSKEQALTVNISDFTFEGIKFQDLSFYVKIKDADKINTAYIEFQEGTFSDSELYEYLEKTLNNIEINGNAKFSGLFSVKFFWDGSELFAYFLNIFKINVSKLMNKMAEKAEIDLKLYEVLIWSTYIEDMIDVLTKLNVLSLASPGAEVEKQSETSEKISFSAVNFLISVTGADKEKIKKAFSDYYRSSLGEYADYSDENIGNYYDYYLNENLFGEINDSSIDEYIQHEFYIGNLLNILSSAGIKISQTSPSPFLKPKYWWGNGKDCPEWFDYTLTRIFIANSAEFVYSGDDLVDVTFFEDTLNKTENLDDNTWFLQYKDEVLSEYNLKIDITFSAGKGKVKDPPSFSIDMTSLIAVVV